MVLGISIKSSYSLHLLLIIRNKVGGVLGQSIDIVNILLSILLQGRININGIIDNTSVSVEKSYSLSTSVLCNLIMEFTDIAAVNNSPNSDSLANIDIREALLSFIENYRDLPVLWDVSSKEYSNKNKKNEAYVKLLRVYRIVKRNATIEDVKKKINSLRTNFRKELRKIEASKRSGANVYKPKCWTFKELSFLSESTTVTPCIFRDNEQRSPTSQCESANPKPIKYKRRKLDNFQEAAQLPPNETDYDQLAITWANELRKMDINQQAFAKKHINEILFEGQLGKLHRNSIVVNGTELQGLCSRSKTVSKIPDDLEWTSDEIESLISLVQINNVIYDQSDPDYNNRQITDSIWKHISSKLKRSPESCSKKWRLLHSEYQERKNFNGNQNIDYKHYFDKIDFLKEFPYDESNNLTPGHENSPNNQSSETCTYNKNTNENKFSISEENVDIKTEFEDDDNITELQNHSGNEISNDAESCGRFNADYLDNVMDNDYGLNEMDSYDNVDFGNRLKPGVNGGGKNNSMELFLLSLVEDASCLSRPSQKEFKLKTLALLNSLE